VREWADTDDAVRCNESPTGWPDCPIEFSSRYGGQSASQRKGAIKPSDRPSDTRSTARRESETWERSNRSRRANARTSSDDDHRTAWTKWALSAEASVIGTSTRSNGMRSGVRGPFASKHGSMDDESQIRRTRVCQPNRVDERRRRVSRWEVARMAGLQLRSGAARTAIRIRARPESVTCSAALPQTG